MILIKLGGSVITDKSKPLAASPKKISGMARAIAKISEPIVIIHGGGSFGHYWSVKYDMHTAERRYDTKGVATVKNSMVQLDNIILEKLLAAGTRPYAMPPAGFMAGPRPIPSRVSEVGEIATSSDMTPVTYGDAIWYGTKDGNSDSGKTYILSGDKIMTHMARILRPRLCIFALGEDGLYTDLESKRLVDFVPAARAPKMYAQGSQRKENHNDGDNGIRTIDTTKGRDSKVMDVTGGMTRKVREAQSISRLGTAVAFVNGNHPKRIQDAAAFPTTHETKPRFTGTLFEAHLRKTNLKEKNKVLSKPTTRK